MNLEKYVCTCSCGCKNETFGLEDYTKETLKIEGFTEDFIKKLETVCISCLKHWVNNFES